MLQINNLTKIYNSKKKSECVALDSVNLSINNNGLVFVLGKSGSGKSTLLNLIGGLDNITSGSITVNGNEISSYKENQLCNYRNSHIGFIFQDYHLIEELTVYENIVLSLNLNKEEDEGKVSEALARVDLAGYENRFPNELSGGERQRIAIARAIVKKPQIILADEPTGNLDNNTATSIVSLLKELSKECLILIVSHNTIDAYKYADRIIELSKGNIINDVTRNPEFKDDLTIDSNTLFYPYDLLLKEEDIESINNNIGTIKKVVRVSDKYLPTKQVDIKDDVLDIKKNNLSILNTIKLSFTFLKSKIFRISLSSFITSAIIVILALALTIVTFDAGELVSSELNKMNTEDLMFKKTSSKDPLLKYSNGHIVEIEDGDIEAFYDAGYEGNIYKLYNNSIYISNNILSYGKSGSILSTKSPYVTCLGGVLVCNKEFVTSRLGSSEILTFDTPYEKSGIYITDYIADAILLALPKYKNYKDILGMYLPVQQGYGYINGIIKTDYLEKYNHIFENIKNMSTADYKKYVESMEYQEFYNDILYYLSIGYSFEEDFAHHVANSTYYTWTGQIGSMNVFADGTKANLDGTTYINYNPALNVSDGCCVFNMSSYNEMFGTNYSKENLATFVPHTITVDFYLTGDNEKQNKKLSLELTVEKLASFSNAGIFSINKNDYIKVQEQNTFCYGLYFDNVSGIVELNDVATKNGYELNSFIATGLVTMTKAVDVFIPIFRLIAVVLCVGIILILVNFSVKMIRDKYHDIGILKAIGTSNKTIAITFGFQIILIALLTIIISTIGYFVFIDLANDVLIVSLRELAGSMMVLDLDVLTFKGLVVLIDIILIVILTLVSLIIPLLKLRSIKPVKIIKTKE